MKEIHFLASLVDKSKVKRQKVKVRTARRAGLFFSISSLKCWTGLTGGFRRDNRIDHGTHGMTRIKGIFAAEVTEICGLP